VPDGQPKRILSLDGISALWVAPGGRYIAVGSNDGFVRLCTPDGKPLHTFRAHEGTVTAFAAAPRRGWLFTGGEDGVVRIWSMPGVELLHGLPGHDHRVVAMGVTGDDAQLIVAGSRGLIQTWTLDSVAYGACFLDLDAMPKSVEAITYERTNEWGFAVRYTLPCGSPTPPGATCTCNCVPGTIEPEPAPSRTPGTTTTGACGQAIPPGAHCTCNCMVVPGREMCSCVPVCTCQAV